MGTMLMKTSRKTENEMARTGRRRFKEMKVRNWREKSKDRGLCNEIVKRAKTHQRL